MLLAGARGTGGGGDWPPPVRSLHEMTAITQTINRERNRPGSNIEAVALLSAARTGTFPVAPLFCRVAAGGALPGLRSASCLAFPLSPPGRGIASGAGAVQPRHLLRAQAQRRRAGKTLHLSHAGGAGDRRGHPFAADQPRRATSAGFAPCSSATAAGVSIIRMPRGFRYLPIPLPRWLCVRSDGWRYLPVKNPEARL